MLFPEIPASAAPDKMNPDASPEPVVLFPQRKDKIHTGGLVVGGTVTPHFRPSPPASGGAAVQGKAHPVQYGRFSAAGGTGDEEQGAISQTGKVHGGLPQIGAKGCHGERNGNHTPVPPSLRCSSRRISSNSVRSSSVISVLHTSRRKQVSTSCRELWRASAACTLVSSCRRIIHWL